MVKSVSGGQYRTTGLEYGAYGKVRAVVLHTGASLMTFWGVGQHLTTITDLG